MKKTYEQIKRTGRRVIAEKVKLYWHKGCICHRIGNYVSVSSEQFHFVYEMRLMRDRWKPVPVFIEAVY